MQTFYIDAKGYPRWKNNKKLVHRDVAKKMVGGYIFPKMVVHHIDGNKLNFRKNNLWIMSRSSHSRFHAYKRFKEKYFLKKHVLNVN